MRDFTHFLFFFRLRNSTAIIFQFFFCIAPSGTKTNKKKRVFFLSWKRNNPSLAIYRWSLTVCIVIRLILCSAIWFLVDGVTFRISRFYVKHFAHGQPTHHLKLIRIRAKKKTLIAIWSHCFNISSLFFFCY